MPKTNSTIPRLRIDLNADLGEGSVNEEAILALVSSANIACGGHTGDAQSMRQALQLAKRYGVAVGAHPSFPDREHFGRKPMQIEPAALFHSLQQQVQDLATIAVEIGIPLGHIKPHGALYNQAASDPRLIDLMIALILDSGNIYKLFALAGSQLALRARAAGIAVIEEAFADRRYRKDGSLVPRDLPGAVIDSISDAVQQSLDLIRSHRLQSIEQEPITMHAQTLCVHGDGAHALALIRELSLAFANQQISIHPYHFSPT